MSKRKMGTKNKLKKRDMRKLRKKQYSLRQIADYFGVTRQAVWQFCKRNDL